MDLIDHQEAAKILNIPDLAIGQCMFDGKLKPEESFLFDKESVLNLKKSDELYLESLR